MTVRRLLFFFSFVTFRCIFLLRNGSAEPITSRKNILLIIVDDLRPALGCYNDENSYTPNIDSLARKSAIFKNAIVQQALCAPSRNSLLTSRRPDTLRLYDFYSYWRTVAGNFTTLPQYFKENGYHTVSFGKVFHPGISCNHSDDQPYSWSEAPFHPPTERYKDDAVCPNDDGSFSRNIVCPVDVNYQPGYSLPDIQSLEKAQSFLRQLPDKPFFLAIGFQKPHIPLKFPRQYLKFHPLENVTLPAYNGRPYGLPTVAWNPWLDLREREDIVKLNLTFPFQPIPDYYTQVIRQSYYAAVTYVDDLLGQLLHELTQTGKEEDTIILLVGDHGWSLGEHGEWAKYSNLNTALHVPLILRVPGVTDNGLIFGHLIELVDIFPTLVDMADLPNIPVCRINSSTESLCTEGVNLAPLIHNIVECQPVLAWKQGAFSQYPRPGTYPTFRPNSDEPRLKDIKIMGYSLQTHQHHYIQWVRFDRKQCKPIWSSVVAEELYELTLDPSENINLVDRKEMKHLKTRLRQQLQAGWRLSAPACLRRVNNGTRLPMSQSRLSSDT